MATTMTKPNLTEVNNEARSNVLAVLQLIEDFGSLLMQETEALKKADYKMVDMLQNDKKIYAKKYHALVMALSEQKEKVALLDMPLREKLIRARTNLTVILNNNMRALEIAKESSRRLVDRILDIARLSVVDDQQTNYSSKGKTQAYASAMTSLSLDQSL